MKRWLLMFVTVFIAFGAYGHSEESGPLKLVQTIKLPADVKGHFDHFEIDLKNHRLFATPESYKAVLVFDLKTGKLAHTMRGIDKPHAVLYRKDVNRLYVTDGEAGDLKIFDATTYALLSSVKLLEDADSIGYDPNTKYLYIDNGGGDVHQTYSMLSVVDTTAGKKVADIKVDGDTLEAMVLDKSSSRIYLNNEANHRLFIACRSGGIIVIDTQSGKEITVLPITKGVDDLVFDATSKRLYASCDGDVSVYQQNAPDTYKLLGKVPTGPLARTALLVPPINRYFVAVPQHGTTNAEIMVFEV